MGPRDVKKGMGLTSTPMVADELHSNILIRIRATEIVSVEWAMIEKTGGPSVTRTNVLLFKFSRAVTFYKGGFACLHSRTPWTANAQKMRTREGDTAHERNNTYTCRLHTQHATTQAETNERKELVKQFATYRHHHHRPRQA